MSRRIGLVLVAAIVLVAVLGVNAIVVDSQTRDAEAREGGELIELADGTLNVREGGDPGGTPIVLLHGLGGSIAWWDALVAELEDDFRIVSLDLLGHGGSEVPDRGYSIDDHARLVSLALGELDVEGAVVVGHSMGGVVATRLAEQASELADSLVLIGTAPTNDATESSLSMRLYSTPLIGQAMNRLQTDWAVRRGLSSAFADDFEVPDQLVDDFRRLTYSSFTRSRSGASDFRRERPLPERITELGLPLLAIYGAEDELVAPGSLSLYDNVPGARTHELDGVGHSPQIERPGETAALIREHAGG